MNFLILHSKCQIQMARVTLLEVTLNYRMRDPGGLGSSLLDIAGHVGTVSRLCFQDTPVQSLFKNDL